MEGIFCQSCGMPMTKPAHFGSEKDGTPSKEYCTYCYKDGAFKQDFTMEQMIEFNIKFLDEFNKNSPKKLTKEEAREQMSAYFPTLKRWKK